MTPSNFEPTNVAKKFYEVGMQVNNPTHDMIKNKKGQKASFKEMTEIVNNALVSSVNPKEKKDMLEGYSKITKQYYVKTTGFINRLFAYLFGQLGEVKKAEVLIQEKLNMISSIEMTAHPQQPVQSPIASPASAAAKKEQKHVHFDIKSDSDSDIESVDSDDLGSTSYEDFAISDGGKFDDLFKEIKQSKAPIEPQETVNEKAYQDVSEWLTILPAKFKAIENTDKEVVRKEQLKEEISYAFKQLRAIKNLDKLDGLNLPSKQEREEKMLEILRTLFYSPETSPFFLNSLFMPIEEPELVYELIGHEINHAKETFSKPMSEEEHVEAIDKAMILMSVLVKMKTMHNFKIPDQVIDKQIQDFFDVVILKHQNFPQKRIQGKRYIHFNLRGAMKRVIDDVVTKLKTISYQDPQFNGLVTMRDRLKSLISPAFYSLEYSRFLDENILRKTAARNLEFIVSNEQLYELNPSEKSLINKVLSLEKKIEANGPLEEILSDQLSLNQEFLQSANELKGPIKEGIEAFSALVSAYRNEIQWKRDKFLA